MSKIVLNKDSQAFKSGDYVALNNTWGKGNLINGSDFVQNVSFNSDDVTKNITFNWSWPKGNGYAIVGYPELSWGDSPLYNGAEETHTYVSSLSELKTFKVDVDISVSAGSQYRNIAFDMWLTDKPLGAEKDITTEVMVWLDKDSVQPWGTKVGVIGTGNDTASVYMVEDVKSGARVWDYIAVIYDKPHLNGGIDMKAIFAALAGKNLISSDDYISGYHLGAELTGGKGEIRVNSVDTDFQVGTKPPAGGTGGTSGNDTIESLPGADTFDGGAGNDTLSFRNSTAAVTADLQTGKASGGYGTGDTFKNFENLTGSNYGDTLFGNADANIISGEGGNDIIDGRGGDDKIYGGAGHDKLSGGAGADVIFGGDGWDRITGGAGRDTMTGGTGGDYFVFNTGDSIPSTPDVILDFSFAEGDRIDLAGVDGNSLISGYQRFTFIGSSDFTKAGQLRVDFHGGDAFIYGDTNGDKKPDFALQLDNVTSLKADAFLF